MFRGTYLMPRTSDPTVSYLPPFSNPHETRRRRVSNIAICPPTYLHYSTYLFNIPPILPYSPYPPSIHPSTNPIQSNPPIPFPSSPPPIQNHAPPPRNKTPPHNRRHNRLRAQKSPKIRTPTNTTTTTTTTANARKKFRRRRRRRVNASES